MSLKYSSTTADYLVWSDAMNLIRKLAKDENYKISLLISLGCFTGLRISDILSLRWKQILDADEFTVIEKKTDKVNIVTIAGTNGSSAQIGRTKGFNKYVKANGWNLLDEQDGDFTQDGGQKIMESYLKSYKDIDVVVCQNDNEAFGAIDALKAAGKTYGKDGDIIIISFDATNAGLKDVKEGSINADFECNPLAAPYVEDIIKKIKDGGKPDSQKVYVDEACFACDDTVSSFKTDEGKDITMTVVDDKVLKERAY